MLPQSLLAWKYEENHFDREWCPTEYAELPSAKYNSKYNLHVRALTGNYHSTGMENKPN